MKIKTINTENEIKTIFNSHWNKDDGIESVHFITDGNWRDPESQFDLMIIDKDGATLYKCLWRLHQKVYDEIALTKARLFDYREGRWVELSSA